MGLASQKIYWIFFSGLGLRCSHGSHGDWKNESAFFRQGILNILEKSANFSKNAGNVWEFYSIFIFSLIFISSPWT